MGTAEVGDGGVEINPPKSITDGARGRVSMGRIVAYGGDDGCNELSAVGGTLDPLDFARLETLALTRIDGLVAVEEGPSRQRWGEVDLEAVVWYEPLPRRVLAEEASAVEVKERCLDNSLVARRALGFELWTSIAERVDGCTLVRPRGVCLNGEDGGGMDLRVVLAGFGDEDDRSSTIAALLLTLAFGRKAGSELMDDGG